MGDDPTLDDVSNIIKRVWFCQVTTDYTHAVIESVRAHR
jgi:hypothetical protein